MALKKVKGTLERVLDKNLQDLVRGIRNHKESESKYIAECVDEIKQELRQENPAVKANAVNKLTYLQMLGYDVSWAAFNVIEVMSSTKFTFKRIGYLAASQTFHEGTDVLMLTTNMIRKDLSSHNMYDSGVALNGLSCFITCDLARDLANDIMTLMTSTKPYLRKKAVLIMYKVFLRFPEALRPAFPRLKEKLEDPDPGVQSAAVNVICELARKNPKNYLSLAPLFFKLMTSSTNNWVLIKIIKLFGALTPLEPRLGKKLIEPLTNLIHSTSAMSLLYECINTVIAVLVSISSGVPNHSASIQLCVQKLRILIEDSDQNLKYLGLLAMSRILTTHPKSVQAHKDLILQCLDDKDESIRLRSLDLLYGMVSKKNLMEIVKKLMIHMDKAEGSNYRDELLSKIIEICSQSNYQYVTNFEWYVSVLVELTRMEGTRHGKLIASQMLDVAIRVAAIRPFAVSQMAVLMENSHLLANNSRRNGICEVLYAAAWICGEFSEHLKEPQETLEAMLRPKITTLPGHIQGVYVQNILKLYSRVLVKAEEEGDEQTIQEVGQMVIEKLPMFVQSADLEVQERACCVLQLMKYVVKLQEKGGQTAAEVSSLFVGELNPVATKAQKKVPVPDGLDLDEWIYDPPSDSSDEDFGGANIFGPSGEDMKSSYHNDAQPTYQPTEEELEKRREARREEQLNNPHYLKLDSKTKLKSPDNTNYENIPVSNIDLSVPLHVPDMYLKLSNSNLLSSGKKSKRSKKKKRRGKKGVVESEDEEEDETPHVLAVSTAMDMPEGANASDGDEDVKDTSDPHNMLDINLDEPLRDDERLPVRTHRTVDGRHEPLDGELVDGTANQKPKKKHKKLKEKDKKKEKKEKKDKKKKSRSIEKEVDDQPDLLGEEEKGGDEKDGDEPQELVKENNVEDKPDTREDTMVDTQEQDKKSEDIEFWLTNNETGSRGESPTAVTVSPDQSNTPTPTHNAVVLTESEEETPKHSDGKHKKKKKNKKEKKEKKEKRERQKNKTDYEEAEGITTPSKENLPPSQQPTPMTMQLPPMSSYKLLGENSTIKMTYETRVTPQRGDQIVISIIFTNLTSHHMKDLEFNVLDTLNSKLIRGVGASQHDSVKVPFVLLPNAQNEGQFAFTVSSITMPQRLRGTLTYILKTSEGSTHDKLDFKLHLPCSSYLSATHCKGPEFAKLLSSGDLTEKSSLTVSPMDTEFPHILAKLCFFLHFTIVEQVENSASLYSRSIQNHSICLLVKYTSSKTLSIDGKCTDTSLLSNVLDEVRTVLTQPIQ
ncbi:AP-3 complex subunit delta-1-like isoform X2 [Liolophura sinensis]|uniref:AP-3 complex subunit delta-1-like isoform X2 n=1 Tax=Liolophura sinensis TaxID=3198878 RepID=UPI003158F34D